MDLTEKLKKLVIETYREFGDEKSILMTGGKSYTGEEIASEIEKETEFGVEMIAKLLTLTIDLLSRNKLK